MVGERGEERLLERVFLRTTGTSSSRGSTPSSSGSGPRIEPLEVELTPDMAETEVLSSAGSPPREATKEFWMAA